MYRYGFELEGFAQVIEGQAIVIPPLSWPVDGFPGLVEIRTQGGQDLEKAYFDLLREFSCLPLRNQYTLNTWVSEHKFSGAELAQLRRKHQFHKEVQDIQNLYAKQPRRLGNMTLASFQINISNLHYEGSRYVDNKGNICTHADRYELVDIPRIVRALDKEFAKEIKETNRQPGFYTIKQGVRLEYRSLPNRVFVSDLDKVPSFLKRIRKAVEEY